MEESKSCSVSNSNALETYTEKIFYVISKLMSALNNGLIFIILVEVVVVVIIIIIIMKIIVIIIIKKMK